MSDDYAAWCKNLAKALIEERDAAVERYIREHKRAAFMADTLTNVHAAIPDIDGGRTFSREKLLESLHEVKHAIGHWVNSSGGDDAWWEQKFDFDEWERDYFGPKPDERALAAARRAGREEQREADERIAVHAGHDLDHARHYSAVDIKIKAYDIAAAIRAAEIGETP
jgi:hypothetical protein